MRGAAITLYGANASPAKAAVFSDCGTWRYALTRTWEPRDIAGLCMFIGLNPSTADAEKDDPTVRRCIRFAKDWGFGGLIMANLYGFRATHPEDLHAAEEPVGPGTDEYLLRLGAEARLVIAAWGADPGPDPDRPEKVADKILRPLHALGLTKDGSPRHPLYMKADSQPVRYDLPVAA